MFRSKFSKFDVVAVAAVILFALLFFLLPFAFREEASVLQIVTPDGSYEYPLSTAQTVTLTSRGITLTVCIENGRARVLESDCPDAVCRNSGWIEKSGETVLCAPAGVTVRVMGGDSDVDFVAG